MIERMRGVFKGRNKYEWIGTDWRCRPREHALGWIWRVALEGEVLDEITVTAAR